MLDAYNQALIAASYGQLSLGEVAVLSETYIERDAFSAADNFTYYEAPAKQVGCRGSRSSAVQQAGSMAMICSAGGCAVSSAGGPPSLLRALCCLAALLSSQALADAGEAPWMYLVLAPLANHRLPPFRAWSGGRAAGVKAAAAGCRDCACRCRQQPMRRIAAHGPPPQQQPPPPENP